MLKKIFSIFISIIFVFHFTSFLHRADAELKRSAVEEEAKDFHIKSVEGKEIVLSEYKGKIVILNFWTTWCTYCQEEIDELIRFSNTTRNQNVEVIGINVTPSEKDARSVIHFVKTVNIPFQIGLDLNGELSKTYQIIGIPTTYIINRRGQISNKLLGPVTEEVLKEQIKGL